MRLRTQGFVTIRGNTRMIEQLDDPPRRPCSSDHIRKSSWRFGPCGRLPRVATHGIAHRHDKGFIGSAQDKTTVFSPRNAIWQSVAPVNLKHNRSSPAVAVAS
jgi:hypothetical protein